MLDTIRFDSDQSWILNGFDFGPIKQLNGAHQAAMIWPGKYSWQDWDQTMILDPWITQDPNNSDYTGNAWLSLIGAALPVGGVILDLFTSGGSSNFNIDKYYPSTGNPYPPGPQWLTAGSAPFSLGVVLDCPVDILITDNAGNRTGNLPDPGQDEAPFFSEIPGLNQYPALLPDGTRSWFLEIPDTDVHLEITGYDKGEFTLYVTDAGSGNLEPFSRIPILTDQKASLTLDPTALKIPAVTFEDGSLVLPDTILDLAQTGYDGTAGETLVEVSLTNISGVPVHGPLHLVLTHMDPGSMSLVSPDGTTPSGSPYVDLTGLLAENRLDPDEEITKEIRFNCPGNIKFKICVELQGLTGTGKTVTARLNDFMIGHQGAWPMKQRTMHQTGRAQFTVPSHRMNDTFFDVISWQTPIPGNPDNENDGRFGGTSMTFFDGAGPDGTDIVLGTYHWPKGIQGMNRHTGEVLWNGNPDNGGEEIAKMTPAFSNDGSSVYLTNQYTASGGSLLAFDTADGPSMVRHNALDITPENLKYGSPVIGPQGRIYVHGWWDRPRAGTDNGTSIAETWQAKNPLGMLKNDAALFQDGAILKVISGGRDTNIKCFDGHTGDELWSISLGKVVDASVTIDPSNGNIYVGAGDNDIYVVGVDKNGNPLPGWPSTFVQVHDWIDGTNNPQRSQAAGCLSHDGSTYYFQTTSEQGDGKLYAVNTMDGSVKWSFDTQAKGPEVWSSASPIVTKNNVIIIGNHDGDTYFAIHDQGNAGVLLDTFQMDASGDVCAKASPTLSSEGQLYLPLRTKWTAGNASQTPDLTVRHLFCSFDLEARFPIPDLADFAADFGKTDSPGSPGDLDRDTDVDGQDLIRFILNYAP